MTTWLPIGVSAGAAVISGFSYRRAGKALRLSRADVSVNLAQLNKGEGGQCLRAHVVNAGRGSTSVQNLYVEGKQGASSR